MTHHKLLPTLLILLSSSLLMAKDAEKEQFNSNIAQFIENKGQITDQHGTPRTDIDYKLSGGPVTIYIGDGQMHYQFYKTETQPRQSLHDNRDPFAIDSMHTGMQEQADSISIYRLDVTLVGANPNAQLITAQRSDYYENYYGPGLGEDGVKARACAKLIYKDVYPGIDWVLYTTLKEGIPSLKYDFVVHNGADPFAIRLRYDGATNLQLQDGALLAETPYGSITEAAPYTYSAATHEPVNSSFILSDNELSFSLGTHSGDIVIDPNLHWATYYEGAVGYSGGIALYFDRIDIDEYSNVYKAGESRDNSNIATTGSFQSTKLGVARTGYIVKFNSAGVRQWATYIGGSILNSQVYFYDLVVDDNNDIYFSGYGRTRGTGLITPGSHLDTVYTNNSHGVFFKFNSNGQRLWGSYYGPKPNTRITGLAVGANDDIYMAGYTSSDTGIATQGAHQTQFLNSQTSIVTNAFIARFNTAGVRLWGSYFGDTLGTDIYNIECDPLGNLIVVGATRDTQRIATQSAYQTSIKGGGDAFISKFDTSGTVVWSTYYGGESNDQIYDVAIDDTGSLYVTGITQSDSGIATVNAQYNTTNTVRYTSFVSKFDSSGNLVWGTYYDTSYTYANQTRLSTILIGKGTGLWLLGATRNPDLATIGTHLHFLQGEYDAIIANFSLDGYCRYASYFGGNEGDNLVGAKIDSNNILYFEGLTNSDTGLVTNNAHQKVLNLNTAGDFVAKLKADIDTVSHIAALSERTLCGGDTFTVLFDITPGGFSSGNVFTAQLSDINGDFSTPVDIGSIVTNSADTITVIIPDTVSTSDKYRLRIVSTLPVGSSPDSGLVIYAYPEPPSITSDSVVCEGDTLHLSTADQGNDVTYMWSGPLTFSAFVHDTFLVNATSAHAGKYTIAATRGICSVKDSINVILKPLPVKPVAASNSPVCSGDTLTLTANTTTTGASYSWSGQGGFSSAAKDTVRTNTTTVMSGDYVVSATLDGCITSDTTTVLVKQSPVSVTLTSNSPVCSGDTLKLSTASQSGINYSWSGPGSFTASVNNAFIANSTTGATGWYYLQQDLNGCYFIDSIAAEVRLTPTTPAVSYNSPLCIGEQLQLSANSNAGATYSWLGANSYSAGQQNPVRANMQLPDTGWYKVYATLAGCVSGWDSVRVSLNPQPFVVVLPNKDSICNGDAITFTALPNNAGSNLSYVWKVNGQQVSAGTVPVYTASGLSNGDKVIVDMTDSTKCSVPFTDESNEVILKVLPWLTPSVTISANPATPLKPNEYITFTANVTNGGANPDYQWLRNGTDVLGAKSNTWSANTLNDNDSISVKVKSSYMCPQPAEVSAQGIVVTVLTGIGEVGSRESINIFPNPNDGHFVIMSTYNGSRQVQYTIHNAVGQVVHRADVTLQHGKQHSVDISHLPAGTYMLRIHTAEGQPYTAKIIKE